MHSMNREIGIGVAWNLASLVASRGSSILFMLFLAALLVPEAFGLIAMIMIVMELAQHLVQSGLGEALVRSKKASDDDFSTIFFSNCGLSVVAYFCLYHVAPVLATFYNQPELESLLRIMGLVVVINAFKVVPVAILSREMNFRKQMIAETIGSILSGIVAVTVAWNGGGVWSLVVQSIVSTSVSVIILWYQITWLPKIVFRVESFQRLFGFGVNLLIIGTIRIIVKNAQVIAIARFFSPEVTGLYFIAYKMSSVISKQLSDAVQKATFPAVARLQDDNEILRNKYRQIIQLLMFIIAPIVGLLAALAEPLLSSLLSKEWSGAVVYLQLLCIVAALYPLHSMNINLLKVKGRSDLVLKIGLFKNFISLVILVATIEHGVLWVVIGQVLSSLIALMPNTYFTARLIEYGVIQQIIDIAKPLLAAIAASGGAYMVTQLLVASDLILLIVGGTVGLILFLSISAIIGVEAFKMILLKLKSSNIN